MLNTPDTPAMGGDIVDPQQELTRRVHQDPESLDRKNAGRRTAVRRTTGLPVDPAEDENRKPGGD